MQEPVFHANGEKFDNPGDYVKRNCQALGISLSQVARDAKISTSTLSRWGNGKNKPFWDTVERVRGVIDGYWERQKAG